MDTTFESIVDDIEQLAIRNGFEDYTGPAGPSDDHIAKNHKALKDALCVLLPLSTKVETEQTDFNGSIDVEIETVKVTDRNTGDFRACTYDRWGFCAVDVFDLDDQMNLREAIKYLLD